MRWCSNGTPCHLFVSPPTEDVEEEVEVVREEKQPGKPASLLSHQSPIVFYHSVYSLCVDANIKQTQQPLQQQRAPLLQTVPPHHPQQAN